MTDSKPPNGRFDQNAFERASRELAALQQRLPESAVVTLAREVVSRLSGDTGHDGPAEVAAKDIAELTAALVSADPEAAPRMIDRLRAGGANMDSLYLTYLANAARRLGQQWEDDVISFADVTIATSRIYGIMRTIRRSTPARKELEPNRRIVLAAVPGEDHTLGVQMAADLLRNRGWSADLEIGHDHETLVNRLRKNDTRIIGLSAGGVIALPALARLVVALRLSNPDAHIIISGKIVDLAPEEVELMAPDAIVTDFEEGAVELEKML